MPSARPPSPSSGSGSAWASPSPPLLCASSVPPSLAAQTPPAKASPKLCSVVRIQSRQAHARSDKPVEITLELLSCHFHESLEVAAAKIGIGKSTMKLVCRQLGVRRWPYRQVGSRAGLRWVN
ncbi:hypothetical protein GUITHDRAFT_102413 [Guillardia theta CCMP2712]|uniref:RWP-RK domain-containing protein n=1 Tax=Guillardia theta (strain CCMP2712) TaxID=905079 RepID=L1JU40_GUITC|nr:hypothetical protein GUITHDRAFT_102413 [Guillardia theta CCMP2712]EKX51804.1 hypothetical protein GUITHDRAFT_102413 [Guillardia theta CCMP2712]|eukprot:XP_005838784.1 hypothetical protein GUITHDRAFT_102413 [Guillardia theta CCMP2712]